MGIKKHNIIVIAVSVLISAAIWIITFHKPKTRRHVDSRVFQLKDGTGWGYDILLNDTIIIRQEVMPVLQNGKPFMNKNQAEKTARIVVGKIMNGDRPTLTKFDIDKILGADASTDDRQKKQE